jgi:glycerol-3-phosphate acyltransferase PlsY
MSGSHRYTTFFERNFGWLLVIFVYITVILSAMQVALATEIGHNDRFLGFCCGVALMSMAFVLFAVAVVLAVWLALFWFHLVSAIRYRNKRELQRRLASVVN